MAAFFDGFTAVVLHNGKPLRELSDGGRRTVKIPFDSEYKLRLKSNGRRALVNIEIDGTDVLSGKQLILGAYETMDLERFVDSLQNGRKFKFVPLSNSGVQDPTSWENGKIKVTFHPEKPQPRIYNDCFTLLGSASPKIGVRGYSGGEFTVSSSVGQLNTNSTTFSSVNSTPTSSLGATVEGGDSSQQFGLGEGFPTDQPVVLEIWMRGEEVAREVVAPQYQVRIVQKNGKTDSVLYINGKEASDARILSVDSNSLKFRVGMADITTSAFTVVVEN